MGCAYRTTVGASSVRSIPVLLALRPKSGRSVSTSLRRGMLAEHLRSDVTKIEDPKEQALFETSAEVLLGLRKAFEDYESGIEPGWK